jgi:hypothetical protein
MPDADARGRARLEPDLERARLKRVFLFAEGRAWREGAVEFITTDVAHIATTAALLPDALLPPLRTPRWSAT